MQGNPCKGVARNPEQGRERFYAAAELAALSDAFGESPADNCLRFTMLTGCRPGEAMRATWSQFDTEPNFWIKPSAEVKQRRIHRIPLAPAALQLIERIRAHRGARQSEFVFPGRSLGEPVRQLKRAWRAAAEKASIAIWRDSADPKVAALMAELERSLSRAPTVKEVVAFARETDVRLPPAPWDARAYDLRHSFASVGAGGGLSLYVIGKLLGHSQTKTTMRYAHLADDPLREAATKIATQIANAGRNGAEIVRLKK